MRVDGETISEREVVEYVERNRETIGRVQPSFFEITTAMAFDHFARREVDVAVVEVGMGGRLDSTNVIRPLLSVITNIGYDHTQFLGDTLGRIAGEKAGIIKEDTPVVVGESQVETKLVFIERAKALRAPILFADQTYRVTDQRFLPDSQRLGIESLLDGNRFEVECDLQGIYQRLNVPTALTALDVLNGSGGLRIAPQDVRRGSLRPRARRGSVDVGNGWASGRLSSRHGTQRVGHLPRWPPRSRARHTGSSIWSSASSRTRTFRACCRCFPGRRTTCSRRPGSAARSTSASSRAGPPVTDCRASASRP